MAARGSASTGMIVLTSILGVATLGFFVSTIIFFASARAAEQAKLSADASSSGFITDQDRNNPVLQRLKAEAKNKSAVAYMLEQQEQLWRRTLGTSSGSVNTLAAELKAIAPNAGESASVLSILKDQAQQITVLKQQNADAIAAKDRALTDKENMAKLMGTLEAQQREMVGKLTADVDLTKKEADTYRKDVETFKADMDARTNKIKEDFAGKETGLQAEIDKLQRDRQLDRQRLAESERLTRAARFTGAPEQSLVDGRVVAQNSADGTLVLGMGRKQRVTLGLTFEVYSDSSAIRPDETSGEYPRGKASVEVIRVDDESSVARILREQKGNPVVTGDVVANALYDPSKVYKFLVFGNFDPQRTGSQSALGASDIKARIESWGGKVVDTLSGDVDFIVLGSRPQVTPEPSSTAPFEYINEHLRLKAEATKYDDLFSRAVSASIPVLNENRLYTLTGG